MRYRRSVAVLSTLVVAALVVAGCAKYKGPADAYAKTGDERATADKRLRSAAAQASVPSFGDPKRTPADFCQSHPMGTLGDSDTVNCEANLQLVYTEQADAGSADGLWSNEQAALRTAAGVLDNAGWDTSSDDALSQALQDRSYDPYPLDYTPKSKRPVQLQLYLVDGGSHPYNTFSRPTVLTPTPPAAGTFAVVFTFRTVYVSEEACRSQCSTRTPTVWPTRYVS